MSHHKDENQGAEKSHERGAAGQSGNNQQHPASDPGMRDIQQSHRSIESQVEGGQNQWEGEPHEGYGNGQGGNGQGSNG